MLRVLSAERQPLPAATASLEDAYVSLMQGL